VRKSSISLIVLGLVVAVAAAVLSSDLVASAQNTNSSTTAAPTKAKTKHRAKQRTPKAVASAEASADATAAMPAATPKPRTGRCDPMQQEQTDLSGTYNGRLKHGDEPEMDATLTITGNNFTMTTGTETHSGRITAVTTCGYTAVTVMMGDTTPPDPTKPPPPPLPAVSLRAKKVGSQMTLMSAPGETRQISFISTGAAKAHVTKHKMKSKTKAKPAAAATPPE
jgi:hypothetical protein